MPYWWMKASPALGVLVHVVAEEVHSLGVVLLVSHFEGGCLGGPGPAPRSPDVEHQDLAPVARHLDRGAGVKQLDYRVQRRLA